MKLLRGFFGIFGLFYMGGLIVPLTVWIAVYRNWQLAAVMLLAGTVAARAGHIDDKRRP